MARQCTQPKRRRNATWFKEKVLLVQTQAEGKELDEELLAFLADPGVVDGQVAQTITYNAAFQTDDLDGYDFDYDDISFAKAVLMANLLSYDSDVLSEKLKGKNVIDTTVSKPNATTIALGMFKLDLEPLAPNVLKKRMHTDYIKHFREYADTLWEIVENARALSPLDSNLDSACKYVQRIREVLVYVKDTFPCLTKPSEKLVAVTPKNKDKRS
ncbi:hypothetical protein Tco_0442263 [Tanacetum coccineum]